MEKSGDIRLLKKQVEMEQHFQENKKQYELFCVRLNCTVSINVSFLFLSFNHARTQEILYLNPLEFC